MCFIEWNTPPFLFHMQHISYGQSVLSCLLREELLFIHVWVCAPLSSFYRVWALSNTSCPIETMSYIKVCRWQVHFWFTSLIISMLERSCFLKSWLPHHHETSFRSIGHLIVFSARTLRRRVVDCAWLIGSSVIGSLIKAHKTTLTQSN